MRLPPIDRPTKQFLLLVIDTVELEIYKADNSDFGLIWTTYGEQKVLFKEIVGCPRVPAPLVITPTCWESGHFEVNGFKHESVGEKIEIIIYTIGINPAQTGWRYYNIIE